MYRKNLKPGTRFGTRTIIEELPHRKNGYILYKVKCDCGDEIILNGSYLRLQNRPCKSCSAKKNTKKGKDHPAYKHGFASRLKKRNKIYSIWVAMRQRCYDPNDPQFKDYGGRGIKVCEAWNNFTVFLEDMGERPPKTQIDRINNDGPYCKENCRWADIFTQANNRRNTTFLLVDGEKVPRTVIEEDLKNMGLPGSLTNLRKKGSDCSPPFRARRTRKFCYTDNTRLLEAHYMPFWYHNLRSKAHL
jgi:hypothetical protein